MDRIKPALAEAARPDGRAQPRDPQTCLHDMLSAVDMIVLPRDVTFDNGAGQTLRLTAKSRRLIGIEAAGLTETDLGEDHLTKLAQIFADFAAKATALEITHAAPTRPDTLSDLGLTAQNLRDTLISAGHLQAPPRKALLPKLKDLAEETGLTWAHFTDGTLTASQGDTEALQQAHDTALPHILKTEHPGDNKAASWIIGASDGAQIAITLEADQCLIAALPPAMIQRWIATRA